MKLIKLKPESGAKYHFGESGLEKSSMVFHSDSLFSAIVNNYVKLYGDGKEDIEKLKSIKISSVLPACSDVFFIPKPFTRLNFNKEYDKRIEDNPKEIKRIEFISLSALENHNQGTLEIEDDLVINKKFLITKKDKEKDKKLISNEIDLSTFGEQKTMIDRNKGTVVEGQLFEVGYIKPSEGMCFYFLLDDSELDKEMQKKLHAAIKLIQDEGLGGKTTTGAGLFKDIEFYDKSIFDHYISSNSDKKNFMSLSLTLPCGNEFRKCCAYQVIERKGYIYRPTQKTKRKKSIRMLSEGSIFMQKIEGKVEDVSPDGGYKVYKFGKFLGIPIKIES